MKGSEDQSLDLPMQQGTPPGPVGEGRLGCIYLGTWVDSAPEHGLFYAITSQVQTLMPLLKPRNHSWKV